MRKPYRVFRFGLIGIVSVWIGLYVGAYNFLQSDWPRHWLKSRIEHELEKAFQRQVSIGTLSGDLLSQITLTDVRFYNQAAFDQTQPIFVTKKIVAHYNLLSAIRTKGDFMAAASLVELSDIQAHFVRSKEGRINLLEFIPPPPPGVVLPPPTFRGKLKFYRLQGTFFDEFGWEPHQPQPFSESFSNAEGIWDFKDIRRTRLELKATLAHVNQQARIQGKMNAVNGQFDFDVSLSGMQMNHWGNYLVAVPGYELMDGLADVSGKLRSKQPPITDQPPFYYDLHITLQDGVLQVPFFPIISDSVSGQLALSNLGLQMTQFSGQINQIPYSGKGMVIFGSNSIDFGIRVRSFDYERLNKVVASLQSFQVSGTAGAHIWVTGTTQRPHLKGIYEISDGEVYGLKLSSAAGTLDFLNHQLHLGVDRSVLANGSVSADATVDFSQVPPVINAKITGQHILGSQLGLAYGLPLKGATDLTATISGPVSGTLIRAELQNSTLSIANQHVSSGEIDAKLWPGKRFQIDRMKLGINANPLAIYANGHANSDMILHLNIAGDAIPIRDILPRSPIADPVASGLLQLSGNVHFAMSETHHTGGRVQAEVTGNMTQLPIQGGDMIQAVSFDARYSDGITTIPFLEMVNHSERLTLKGKFSGMTVQELTAKAAHISLAHPVIQSLIPIQFHPVSGTISATAEWSNHALEGDFQMSSANIQGQPIDWISLSGRWADRWANVRNGVIRHGKSVIQFNGRVGSDGKLDLNLAPNTHVELGDFSGVLSRFGAVAGRLDISGPVSGNVDALNGRLDFSATDVQYNTVQIPYLSGQLMMTPSSLGLLHTDMTIGDGTVNFSGSIGRANNREQGLSTRPYRLEAKFSHIELGSLAQLLARLNQELGQKSDVLSGLADSAVLNTDRGIYRISDSLQQLKTVPIYSGQSDVHRLHLFHEIEARQAALVRPLTGAFGRDFRGVLDGQLSLSGLPGQFPKVAADLKATDIQMLFARANSAQIRIQPAGNKLSTAIALMKGDFGGGKFDEFVLGGDLDVQGDFGISDLTVVMPSGRYPSLLTGTVPLAPFYLESARRRPLSLRLSLHNESLKVLSLFSPYLESVQGEGDVRLNLAGPLDAPEISGKLGPLKNVVIQLSDQTVFRSPFVIPTLNAEVSVNRFSVADLSVFWKGEDTRHFRSRDEILNHFQLTGSVGLSVGSFLKPEWMVFDLDLSVKDTVFALNFPDVYTGSVALKSGAVKGPYRIALSSLTKEKAWADLATEREIGPTVFGHLTLSDGNITSPKFTEKKTKPSFLYQLMVDIDKEVGLSGGLFDGGLGALAGSVNLDLAQGQSDIVIKGSSNAPMILSPIAFKSGEFQFFSRNFEILDERQQQQFSKSGALQQSPNTIRFETQTHPETGKRSLVPQFDIIAATVIEPVADRVTDNAQSSNLDGDYRAVLAYIHGPPYELQSWTFSEFDITDPDRQYRFLDNRLQNWRISARATYTFNTEKGGVGSESDLGVQNLIQVLMPGYYKEVIDEFARDNFQSDKTKKLISFYGERQINSVFQQSIRPSERALAKQLGLVDVRVNYDLGNALLKSASDLTGYQGLGRQEDSLGLDLVSRFFVDQMFLRVQTNLDLTGQQAGVGESLKLSELELSYFPFRNSLSLNIANVRNEYDEFRPRYSLRYAYEF